MNIITKVITKIKSKFIKPKETEEFVKPMDNDVLSSYYAGKYRDESAFEEDMKRMMFNALASSDEDLDKNIRKMNILVAMRKAEEKKSIRPVDQEEKESRIEGGRQKTLSLRRSQYTIH